MQNYIKWLSYKIYIVIGVLTMYDAWDIIVEIPSTCNQLKFNTCKAKVSFMLTTQRSRLGWPCNHQVPPHFFLDFSQALGHLISSLALISHGSTQNLNSHFTFVSFLLRKVLGTPLSPFWQTHGSTLWKKDKTSS